MVNPWTLKVSYIICNVLLCPGLSSKTCWLPSKHEEKDFPGTSTRWTACSLFHLKYLVYSFSPPSICVWVCVCYVLVLSIIIYCSDCMWLFERSLPLESIALKRFYFFFIFNSRFFLCSAMILLHPLSLW